MVGVIASCVNVIFIADLFLYVASGLDCVAWSKVLQKLIEIYVYIVIEDSMVRCEVALRYLCMLVFTPHEAAIQR